MVDLTDVSLVDENTNSIVARHNWLRDELFNTASAACLGPTREGRALLPGEEGKPADVFLPHWAQGKDAALDVTVVNPLQVAMVN